MKKFRASRRHKKTIQQYLFYDNYKSNNSTITISSEKAEASDIDELLEVVSKSSHTSAAHAIVIGCGDATLEIEAAKYIKTIRHITLIDQSKSMLAIASINCRNAQLPNTTLKGDFFSSRIIKKIQQISRHQSAIIFLIGGTFSNYPTKKMIAFLKKILINQTTLILDYGAILNNGTNNKKKLLNKEIPSNCLAFYERGLSQTGLTPNKYKTNIKISTIKKQNHLARLFISKRIQKKPKDAPQNLRLYTINYYTPSILEEKLAKSKIKVVFSNEESKKAVSEYGRYFCIMNRRTN